MRPLLGCGALAILGVIMLAGCPKTSATADAGTDAATAAAPSASASASAVSVNTDAFTGGLRGTLDTKHPIVMHLTHSGGTLDGYYYYVPSIDDLQVHGTVTAAGVVHLDETNNGKPSGEFDGKLDAHDSLDGTWSDPKHTRSLAFHLDLVRNTHNAPATVVERKQKSKNKPYKKFDAAQWNLAPVCDLDIAFPDVLGAIQPPDVEMKVDKSIRDNAVGDMLPCEAPYILGADYKTRTNAAGVYSVEQPNSNFAFGMPHGNFGTTYVNLSIPSGRTIELKDILTSAGITLVENRIMVGLGAGVDADTRKAVKESFGTNPPDFSIEKADIRVSIYNQLPHGLQGAAPDDVVINVVDLESVRVSPSPVDALWGK